MTGEAEQDRRFGPLYTVTAQRPTNAGDRDRAAAFLARVRTTLASYRHDRSAAARDYDASREVVWGPYLNVPRRSEVRGDTPVDVRLPAGLLALSSPPSLRADVFVGVVFIAPSDTTGASLDAIVPLSVARWVRVHPRCARPAPDLWMLDVFPLEEVPSRIWHVPPPGTLAPAESRESLPPLR